MAECSDDVWSCLNRAQEQHRSYDVHRRRLVVRQAEEPYGISRTGNATATSSDWEMSDQTAMIILGSIAAVYFSATAAICSAIVWVCIRIHNFPSSNNPVVRSPVPFPSPAAGTTPPHTHQHDPNAKPGKSNLRQSQGIMIEGGGESVRAVVTALIVKGRTLYPVKSSQGNSVKPRKIRISEESTESRVPVTAPTARGRTLYPVKSSREKSVKAAQPGRQPFSGTPARSHDGLEMDERKMRTMQKKNNSVRPRKIRISDEHTESEV